MFIIIGIVMVIIFGLIFYMIRADANSGTNPDIPRVINTKVDFESIEGYIESCLEDVSKEAIVTVGYQGGNLWDYQVDGGIYFDESIAVNYTSEYNAEKYNLTLAMWDETNMGYSDIVRNVKIAYPPLKGTFPYGLNRFGRQPTYANFPKLCMTEGTHGGASLQSSCESFDPYQSIQALVQEYIANRTPGCLDFEPYRIEKGYNVTIGEPNVSVIMGEKSVQVKLEMPVHAWILEEEDVPVETRMTEFHVELPVRLRQIHELAWHTLEHDAKNIFLNLHTINNRSIMNCRIYNGTTGDRTDTGSCLKEGMSVRFEKNDTHGFIIIEDNKSLLMSHRPYQFVIAIGNRKPHLDKISYHNYSDAYENYLSGWYRTTPENLYAHTTRYPLDEGFDVIVDVGEYLTIIPFAIDPDEDADSYQRTVMDEAYSYSSATLDHVFSSTHHFTGTPYKWGSKDVKYATDLEDIGDHTVRVTATDTSGASNSKTFKVEIRCVDQNIGTDLNAPYSLDTDEYNDCCDEAGGYDLIKTKAHSCGLCKRCNNDGVCEFYSANMTIHEQECGACNYCNATTQGCEVNDDYDSACPAPTPQCCRGGCVEEQEITDPGIDWTECPLPNYHYSQLVSDNPRNRDCWTPGKECIRSQIEDSLHGVSFKHRCLIGLYTNRPVSGTPAQNVDPLNPCSQCQDGMCIS